MKCFVVVEDPLLERALLRATQRFGFEAEPVSIAAFFDGGVFGDDAGEACVLLGAAVLQRDGIDVALQRLGQHRCALVVVGETDDAEPLPREVAVVTRLTLPETLSGVGEVLKETQARLRAQPFEN